MTVTILKCTLSSPATPLDPFGPTDPCNPDRPGTPGMYKHLYLVCIKIKRLKNCNFWRLRFPKIFFNILLI